MGPLHIWLYICSVDVDVSMMFMIIFVLSLDTAVSFEFGDLMLDSPSWNILLQLYELGLVASTLAGTPCETFSEARFCPPDPTPDHCNWPQAAQISYQALRFGRSQAT